MTDDCTRAHRMREVACYVVMPDGGVWTVYATCEHGVEEVTPLWLQRLPEQSETAAAATATVESRT